MTSPINPKANKGQALAEAALLLPVAVIFIGLLFFASYRALVYFYADAALHEAMICTDDSGTSACEREFEKHVRKVILQGESVRIELRKSSGDKKFRLNGKVEISSRFPIVIKKEMQFPLRGSS